MAESTKISFAHRRIAQMGDITDLVEMLFPGNRNQQHAAARILHELKWAQELLPHLAYLEKRYGISRRTLQRARAKLARLGLIERVSWMNTRYGGFEGWKLSTRFSSSLRLLGGKVDQWRTDRDPKRTEKERVLIDLLD